MTDQIVEPWRINNRVNFRLIARISDAGMRCTLSTRGGRNVVRQFAHLHNNRIWHLQRRANALAKGAHLFSTYDDRTGARLSKHLRIPRNASSN